MSYLEDPRVCDRFPDLESVILDYCIKNDVNSLDFTFRLNGSNVVLNIKDIDRQNKNGLDDKYLNAPGFRPDD